MITGTPKPIEEIMEMLEPYDNIVLAGCHAEKSLFGR
jgi:hypothetical protein